MKEILQKTAESRKSRGHLDPAGFDRHIRFYTYAPPEDLAHVLEHFWVIQWDKAGTYHSEQVMHRPYVDIFLSEVESGIQGTFRGKRTYKASDKGRIIGARFLPGAFHALWPGDMAELQDKFMPIGLVFPEMDKEWIAELLKQDDQAVIEALIQLLRTKKLPHDQNVELLNKIILAVEKDESLWTVAGAAKYFGRSERRLQQLTQEYLGLGLKWFMQRYKLLAAADKIRAAKDPNWSSIAYDCGYSSQQHFIADFKRVIGKTPLRYRKELQ